MNHIVGDVDLRGRYLPTALLRLNLETYADPITGRGLEEAHLEVLRTAYQLEHGVVDEDEDEVDQEYVQDLWKSAWEILEEIKGYTTIDENDVVWRIDRNDNGDLIISNSAVEE